MRTIMGCETQARRDQAVEMKRRPVFSVAAVVAVGIAIGGSGLARAGTSASPVVGAATPTITILSPRQGASYQRHSRVVARFRCTENAIPSAIVSCRGTVPRGHAINTRSVGRKSFTVTATDTSGKQTMKTVHYGVWAYINPLREVAGLRASRIDMGVDYSGSGPILAIGSAKVMRAGYFPGPERCWGKTCAPAPGGWVSYRLLNGPFRGKYVYIVENITVKVKAGQLVGPGQEIAVLHRGSPNLEIGWAAGRAVETLAVLHHHQCTCTDPGGWSATEGRNFNGFLKWLGAPSGYLQGTPHQHMPRGWPGLPARDLNRKRRG
jgi:murein DD-endopeptidase MepM/ murein hydrolase activator NlpD